MAEETIRNVVETVIETGLGGTAGDPSGTTNDDDNGDPARDYFSDQEDRIVDNMLFAMAASASASSSDGSEDATAGGDDDDDANNNNNIGGGGRSSNGYAGDDSGDMEYAEWDLSTQFGRDTARGHHRGVAAAVGDASSGAGKLLAALEPGSSSPSSSFSHSDQVPLEGESRPRVLALAAHARLAIRRSIMRTSRAVPSMRFPQMVACGIVFASRAVTANPWFGAVGFVGAR